MIALYIFLCIVLGYLVGSIPVALVLGKTFRGIDIRDYGSHNLGATNAGRVLGRKYFFGVMILDAIKCGLGILVGYLLYLVFKTNNIDEYYTLGLSLAGTSAMIGHCYPLFADFRGGKGVATAAGYLLLTTPLCAVIGLIIFTIICSTINNMRNIFIFIFNPVRKFSINRLVFLTIVITIIFFNINF